MAGRLGTAPRRDPDDQSSLASFADGPSPPRPGVKHAWTGSTRLDNEAYHRMAEEYRAAKAKQSADELKIKQLAAQLARTEEAAKRALIRSDQGVKGSTAQALLDAQRQVQQLRAENAELASKLAREKKRAADFRASAEDNRRRLEAALREQRSLVRKLGEAERSLGGSAAARTAARKAAAEQEFWSEEAGRRFAQQQEELVSLREHTAALQVQLAAAVPAESAAAYVATITELQQLVRFYEARLASSSSGLAAGGQVSILAGDAAGNSEPGCGAWLLESLAEGGACFLWEAGSGRLFSDPPPGIWPRPLGLKPGSGSSVQLGVQARLDAVFRALSEALAGSGARPGSPARPSGTRVLPDALQQMAARGACASGSCSSVGSGQLDTRDVSALLAALMPGVAHKDAAELAAWLQLDVPLPPPPPPRQQQQQVQHQQQHMVSLADLDAALRDLLAARDAVRQGSDLAVNETLLRVRRLLRQEPRAVAAAFDALQGPDGCITLLQAPQLLRQPQLLPDLSAGEGRCLLTLLHEWDLTCSARVSLTDLHAALQLLKLVRLPPGSYTQQLGQPGGLGASHDRPDSRQSTVSNTSASTAATRSAADHAAGSAGRQWNKLGKALGGSKPRAPSGDVGPAAAAAAAGLGPTLKEAFLRERVASLEAELAAAKANTTAGGSQQLELLRAEVGRYKARLSELESDFLSLDVVAHTEVGDSDAEMRKAWFTAAAFKKRYVEHKLELDAIKATAEKMQAALDDTHRALHAEAARRMALEEAAATAKLEASRAKELAAAITAERAERLKLEKDYLELQGRAFAAPGGALAEVRVLREELLAARREVAVGEAREAELRREVAAIKRQLEGVSPEEHRRLARELADSQRKAVSAELELRAALDKLEVYRRAEQACSGGSALGLFAPARGGSEQPDEGKSEEELRHELNQLRQAMALEAEELTKLRKLLDMEGSISVAAKAALEEAQSALAAAKAEAAQQLARVRRELDAAHERTRKLEAQLRGAYGGLGKVAQRASSSAPADAAAGCVRVSRRGLGASAAAGVAASFEGLLGGLAPHENVIELVVGEAVLSGPGFGPDTTSFVSWDFFMHDSQATPLVSGERPNYDTTVQYVCEADSFLLDYMSKQQLALELHEARCWEAAPVGVAHMPLSLLLQDLEVGAALATNRAWHHVDINGSGGQVVGRLRIGFRVAKPLDKLLAQQQQAAQQAAAAAAAAAAAGAQDADSGMHAADTQQQASPAASAEAAAQQALEQAAQLADAKPASASHLLVTLHRCDGLARPNSSGAVARPYLTYRPPGRAIGHDSAVAAGPDPVLEDAAAWALVRSDACMRALQQHVMQVAVFDDAVPDAAAALLGIAAVPLASLAGGVPVHGSFAVMHPSSGVPAGHVWVTAAWHNLLRATATELPEQAPPAHAAQVLQRLQPPPAAPEVPAVSPAAAAAVAAAIDKCQQHQQAPLLAASPAGVPTAPFTTLAASQPRGMLLLPAGRQLASASFTPGSPNKRYAKQLEQSADGLPATVPAVLERVSPDSSTWGDLDSRLYVKVEGLRLSPAALGDASFQPHVFVSHMLAEDFTHPAQQCTPTLPTTAGLLPFQWAVAYTLADPRTKALTPAGRALAGALASAEDGAAPRLVLPLLLASSPQATVTDFSAVECIATCEVDLSDIWQGTSGDLAARELPLLPAVERAQQYADAPAGHLCITLLAARVLATLRQQVGRA